MFPNLQKSYSVTILLYLPEVLYDSLCEVDIAFVFGTCHETNTCLKHVKCLHASVADFWLS